MNRITNDIFYVGVNDHNIDLFEGQYFVPNGMSYNSYIIMDKKIAVVDSVDKNFASEWIDNIKQVIENKAPDYLIIQHMEPDHSGSIMCFLEQYPNTFVVGNSKTFKMIEQFFHKEVANKVEIKENDILNLGNHVLKFIFAPMVHWPEVMMTYDDKDKVIFTADAFGKFGSLDCDEEWKSEARRYYIGIVGKFGIPVQTLIKKVSNLDFQIICPLHGPTLASNLDYYLNLYNTWSSYKSEEEGILITYTSVYGNTKKVVYELESKLKLNNYKNIKIIDLARCDLSEAVSMAFKYNKIVFATTTYNGTLFPFMNTYIDMLVERNFQNKAIAIIDNGTWAPQVSKTIKAKLETSKNLTFIEPVIKIMSSLDSKSDEQLVVLAKNLIEA